MTDQAFATLNGAEVAKLRLHVSAAGPWFADVELAGAPAASGAVTLVINGTTLKGTIEAPANGTFAGNRVCRVVGGGCGWGKLLPYKGYHNDAGVKTLMVAQEAAKAAGERLGTFSPPVAALAHDYARQAGTASIALADAGGVWWVDYDGLTNVAAARPTTTAKPGTYEVLEFNPRTRRMKLGVEGLTVGVGSILTERLDAPETIRAFDLTMTGRKLELFADVAGQGNATSPLERVLRSIVERIVDGWLWGKWRYRVVTMAGDGRVTLQAVNKSARVPDLLSVEQWPGVAGAHATLKNGAIVLVEFIEGRRDLPVVTGYAGKQHADFVPDVLTLGASDPDSAIEVAYKGATVKVLTPPAVFQGTINGFPAVGAVVWPSAFTLGTIEVGTPKVKVGIG